MWGARASLSRFQVTNVTFSFLVLKTTVFIKLQALLQASLLQLLLDEAHVACCLMLRSSLKCFSKGAEMCGPPSFPEIWF